MPGDPYTAPAARAPVPRRGRPRSGPPAHRTAHHRAERARRRSIPSASPRSSTPPRCSSRSGTRSSRSRCPAARRRRARRIVHLRDGRPASSSRSNRLAEIAGRAAHRATTSSRSPGSSTRWALAHDRRAVRRGDGRRAPVHPRRRRVVGAGYDLLLTPTAAEPAPFLGDLVQHARDPMRPLTRAFRSRRSCAPFNVTGQPAMSVPLYWTADGRPRRRTARGRPVPRGRAVPVSAAQLEAAQPWTTRVHACRREPVSDLIRLRCSGRARTAPSGARPPSARPPPPSSPARTRGPGRGGTPCGGAGRSGLPRSTPSATTNKPRRWASAITDSTITSSSRFTPNPATSAPSSFTESIGK